MSEQGYCVKCKKSTDMVEPKEVTLKNGRLSMQGKCVICGTKMCRIMGKKKDA